MRRAGELLAQIEPNKPGPKAELDVGNDNQFGRTDAARRAGFSERQQAQAIRIAAVPEADFERQVDSPAPPTLRRADYPPCPIFANRAATDAKERA